MPPSRRGSVRGRGAGPSPGPRPAAVGAADSFPYPQGRQGGVPKALGPRGTDTRTCARGPSFPPAAEHVDRALVVDDNFDVAESLTWVLEGLAREIKMVHSGAAALEASREWRPDLGVCDLGRRGRGGEEVDSLPGDVHGGGGAVTAQLWGGL